MIRIIKESEKFFGKLYESQEESPFSEIINFIETDRMMKELKFDYDVSDSRLTFSCPSGYQDQESSIVSFNSDKGIYKVSMVPTWGYDKGTFKSQELVIQRIKSFVKENYYTLSGNSGVLLQEVIDCFETFYNDFKSKGFNNSFKIYSPEVDSRFATINYDTGLVVGDNRRIYLESTVYVESDKNCYRVYLKIVTGFWGSFEKKSFSVSLEGDDAPQKVARKIRNYFLKYPTDKVKELLSSKEVRYK